MRAVSKLDLARKIKSHLKIGCSLRGCFIYFHKTTCMWWCKPPQYPDVANHLCYLNTYKYDPFIKVVQMREIVPRFFPFIIRRFQVVKQRFPNGEVWCEGGVWVGRVDVEDEISETWKYVYMIMGKWMNDKTPFKWKMI